MLILLVNDDGKDSKRLEFTRKALQKHAEVITVAPYTEQSGKSMAISMGDIRYEKIEENFYAVEGTPVDCVNFGLFGLNLRPDYVVAGINKGYNLGIDTMYSGTVGGALQAHYYRYQAMAFSGDYKGHQQIEKLFEKTFLYILEKGLASADYVLNVNFPREENCRFKGFKITKRCYDKMEAEGRLALGYFKKIREKRPGKISIDFDVQAIRDGYVSISKITFGE